MLQIRSLTEKERYLILSKFDAKQLLLSNLHHQSMDEDGLDFLIKASMILDSISCAATREIEPAALTRGMFRAVQHTDRRCQPPEPVSAVDAAALQELGPVIELLKNEAGANKK